MSRSPRGPRKFYDGRQIVGDRPALVGSPNGCDAIAAGKRTLEYLESVRIDNDIRKERRALTADEFTALIVSTRQLPPLRGLSGERRALLYTFAANTGLRANPMASFPS